MRGPRFFLGLCLFVFAGTARVRAETVELNDGTVLKGHIQKADAQGVTIETPDGVIAIQKDRIKTIEYATPASPAAAAPSENSRPSPSDEPLSERAGNLRFYGSIDVFAPGNVANGLQSDVQTAATQLSGAGYSGAWALQTKAAVGARIGLSGGLTDHLDLGMSIGFIAGPNSDASLSVVGGGKTGVLDDQRHINFLRFLVEPTLHLPINGSSAFHLGAGLGLARGTVDETLTCTGSACVQSGSSVEGTSSWNGFTWEISPYFSIERFLIGFRYAGFPSFKGNSSDSKIDWSTGSFFTGFQF